MSVQRIDKKVEGLYDRYCKAMEIEEPYPLKVDEVVGFFGVLA